MPKDNEVDEKVIPDSAERATPVAWNVIQIGARGSAFDPPNTKRAFTYDKQPGNVLASSLGHACYRASQASAGDSIDRGLGLLKALQEDGFGVFMIGEVVTDHAATVAELRAEVERRKDALAAMSQFAKVAEQRADAAERRVWELKSRIQSALANVAVPKMSESRAEYFKAGARAAIAAVNDALTGADPT